MRRKHFIIISWLLPASLLAIFLINRFTEVLDDINVRAISIVIGIISIFLNAIIFRPQEGSTKPDGPAPKDQIQRLFHAVLTGVALFAILRFTK
ncbi:MAG: hypothetical protein K8S87_03890 [Planctomycetes bacterium]|nr:hypothetical protein [Planctomycetota bacterium]